jgi:succinate dehydrogenase/fumarate reductase flavoprotein subunit
LRATIDDWNRHARQGDDPAFGRGTTVYQRYQGDASITPNPCVAPIEEGPFLAVRVVPGSFGCFAGLRTDASARVVGADNQTIQGLFAAGTDAVSVMGGFYPAGGINLGPALTFGYIAGRTAAGLPPRMRSSDTPAGVVDGVKPACRYCHRYLNLQPFEGLRR